ncbi:thioredoxin family protein [Polynucleobacter sp. es-MAR-4]|uniref:thioredoxin family protein n=1 Tax=Polynucleobacter sp. es-MAR-4 TaxID=1855655 RepID=UPI001C0B13AF|nr:thioredoxin family protein [Polynucleobacter sp. es-MAR-4]MBU3636072.1 thioredoxin family protein [Polynucleobacter sp. es-MAR-4]
MKSFIKVLLVFASFQAVSVFAAGQEFTQANFDTLQAAGKPAIVHVHADWCPTCKSQDAILNPLMKSPEFKGVSFLQVSFDDQKDVLKKFNVANQSTIIVFKGGKEVGRSVGDTKAASIDALAKKSL